MEPEHSTPAWPTMTVDAVADHLKTDLRTGLTEIVANARLGHAGPNRVTGRAGPGPIRRLLRELRQPLVAILLVAGLVTLLVGEPLDAGVIAGVVLVNVLMGFFQESKAISALAALARTMAATAQVRRDGRWSRRDAADLVPGDVVALRAGDKVPADLRLFACQGLRLDESALTGESAPVDKLPAPVPADTPLAEQGCLAFASTLVVNGQGQGLVVGTGDAAVIGRIAALTATADSLDTPFTRQVARFSQLVLVAILVLAALTFTVGLARGQTPPAMFLAAVALAVGAIPEGLPAAVTVILAMGVARLARRRAIIRHLPAVETLGSATVICTDKTGTLTENRMTATEILAGGVIWRLRGDRFLPDDPADDTPLAREALTACLLTGLLCNDAAATTETPPAAQGNAKPVSGDPTELALVRAAALAGLDRPSAETALPRRDELPFESERMFMATLHDQGPGASRRLLLKGSPEVLLARAAGEATMTQALGAAAATMGRRGLRVLALAAMDLPADTACIAETTLAGGWRLLGLAGLLDPPRPEAAAAVAVCRRAGIRVKMITGDQPATATAIGAQVGLNDSGAPVTISGRELAAVSDADLPRLAAATDVFARVSPEQKLRLVRALRSQGQVTAMTGDGVNDAPALRQADIGVAMGARGSDAAREAADLVLADDNFATLAAAVEEGRAVFDNLIKYIVWTLPANLGEGLVILAAVLAGTELPIAPVQVLWINMTTAGSLGLTLAFEPREPGLMDRPPRDANRPILDAALLRRVVLVGALLLAGAFGLYHWELALGAGREAARTVAVNVFVATEAFYLPCCRSLTRPALAMPLGGNPWVLAGIAAALGLQVLFTYAPVMQGLFGTADIGLGAWLRVLGVGLAGFFLVEIEKRLFPRP